MKNLVNEYIPETLYELNNKIKKDILNTFGNDIFSNLTEKLETNSLEYNGSDSRKIFKCDNFGTYIKNICLHVLEKYKGKEIYFTYVFGCNNLTKKETIIGNTLIGLNDFINEYKSDHSLFIGYFIFNNNEGTYLIELNPNKTTYISGVNIYLI